MYAQEKDNTAGEIQWLRNRHRDYEKTIQFSQAQLAMGQQHAINLVDADALAWLGYEVWNLGDESLAQKYSKEAVLFARQVKISLLHIAYNTLGQLSIERGEIEQACYYWTNLLKPNLYGWGPVQWIIQLFAQLAAKRAAQSEAMA